MGTCHTILRDMSSLISYNFCKTGLSSVRVPEFQSDGSQLHDGSYIPGSVPLRVAYQGFQSDGGAVLNVLFTRIRLEAIKQMLSKSLNVTKY